MTHNLRCFLLLLILLLLSTMIGSANTVNSQDVSLADMSCALEARQTVSGMITDIIIPTAQPPLALLRIESDYQQDKHVQKLNVEVTSATQLLQENSDGISRVMFADLKSGKRVQISFTSEAGSVVKAIEVRLLPETD